MIYSIFLGDKHRRFSTDNKSELNIRFSGEKTWPILTAF